MVAGQPRNGLLHLPQRARGLGRERGRQGTQAGLRCLGQRAVFGQLLLACPPLDASVLLHKANLVGVASAVDLPTRDLLAEEPADPQSRHLRGRYVPRRQQRESECGASP